jgi:hypothetical protein
MAPAMQKRIEPPPIVERPAWARRLDTRPSQREPAARGKGKPWKRQEPLTKGFRCAQETL